MKDLSMNKKEREQIKVFEQLKIKQISQSEAAIRLGLTTRWVREKMKRYLLDNDAGVIHKSRGRVSPRRCSGEKIEFLLDLCRGEWIGFGPTFAAQKLLELYEIAMSKETIRKILVKEGLLVAKKATVKHRKRRERRTMRGMLIQLDGSKHDWFEGRGVWCTLLVFVDDATSEIVWLEFAPSESVQSLLGATKRFIQQHGRPTSFYVDFGSVFSVNTNNPERDKKTQWERILGELNIEVIHAHSPQAKGRVERAHGTLQDRLVKEMRLAKVASIEQANAFLIASNFMKTYNDDFGKVPIKNGSAYRMIEQYDLDALFCVREERVLNNDYTITYQKRIFQLHKQQQAAVRPKEHIAVDTRLDGSINLSIRGATLHFSEINTRPMQEKMVKTIKPYAPQPVHENSRRWIAGLPVVYQLKKIGRVDNEAGLPPAGEAGNV